jgi:hypothetical protein
MEQGAPAANVAGAFGQELIKENSVAFGPVSATVVKVTGDEPGLVTLMVCPALIVPMICGLKTKFEGFSMSVVAAPGNGGLARIMPKGLVKGTVVETVFVEVWMMDRAFPLVFAT